MKIHNNQWIWGESHTIILDNGNALCKVSIEKIVPSIAFLSDLSVVKEARRKGWGKTLMLAAERIAREKGAKEIRLVVNAPQWTADWYGRLGYEYIGLTDYGCEILRKIL